ncbi:WSC-domain-containing protein [Cadophora sp. DSE1049]|nr:WSC-domain-containing protein [Cadophora sp. DSE1049]
MTAKACLDGCASLGFSLAGLEWGRECFCGNTIIGDNRPVAEERCNSACTGNKSQNCGGPAALNIYIRENFQMKIVVHTFPNARYRDSATNRIFPDRANPDIDRNTMTVEKCIDNCADQSYTSAGLEFGGECYCGNVTYPIGTVAPSSECNMACLGDSTQ